MSTNAATQMVLGVVILIVGMIAFGIFVVVLSGDDILGLAQFGSYTGVTQLLQAASAADGGWIPRFRRIPDVPWNQGHERLV